MTFSEIGKIIFAISIILFGVVLRIFLNEKIGIPNFEGVTALSLLSGSFFGGIYSFFIPFLMMFFSDLYFGNTLIFIFTWSAFVLVGVFGTLIKKNSKYYLFKITGAGIFSTLFFYMWTNFGWWLTFGMYPMTAQGLLECYLAGLPFLKNQLISAIIFTMSFTPVFSLISNFVKVNKKEVEIKEFVKAPLGLIEIRKLP